MCFNRKRRRIKKEWETQFRKELFNGIYRYLRFNKELLEDPIYQAMYDYYRGTLIAYWKRNVKRKRADDEQVGELVDAFADTLNRASAERINEYKPWADDLYKDWKHNPDKKRKIRI